MVRRHKAGEVKQAVSDQLEYVKKNLETLGCLMLESSKPLKAKRLKRLATIQEVVRQQEEMLREDKHSVAGRIVSLRQPHARPIVRGKARAPVEFGEKPEILQIQRHTAFRAKARQAQGRRKRRRRERACPPRRAGAQHG
ncbi:MAG: hypothetical protein FWG53_04635 [Clostridiales bacterium]|nr:hypothetical protein [Clostridiales bacterium]